MTHRPFELLPGTVMRARNIRGNAPPGLLFRFPRLALSCALLLGLSASGSAVWAAECTANVSSVVFSPDAFRGDAAVLLERSNVNRPVELVLDASITYQSDEGTDSTYALAFVHVEPSGNFSDTFSIPIRPDLGNPSLRVSEHCGQGQHCTITNISVDYAECWDPAERPEGRVDLGDPDITIRD